jgi:coatomer protein complex subunit gamma
MSSMFKGRELDGFALGDDSTEYKDEYSKLDQSALVQNSKMFNEKTIDLLKARDILNKVIFMLNQNKTFEEKEKSTLFFNVTKLFMSQNPQYQTIRRLMYILIK